MIPITEQQISEFWDNVDKQGVDDCWPWKGNGFHKFGYGLVSIRTGKRGGFKTTSSRVACFLGNGAPENPKAFSLHACDNPPCCNPRHLRWGTPRDNVTDAISRDRHIAPPKNYKGRHVGKMPRGDTAWNSTLNESAVRDIWSLHMTKNYNITEISEKTGFKKSAVSDVCRGRTWRHLIGAPSVAELREGGKRRGINQFTAHSDI